MKIKTSVALGVLLVFSLASVALSFDDAKPKKNEVAWLSFEQGLAAAKKEKKMMVVDFYTTWCGWCKVMDKETYGNANVIQFAKEKLVLVKVNAESNEKTRFRDKEYTYRELATAFGVTSYPATAFIDASGEVLTLVPGYIPPDKFMPVLEFLADGHHKTMTFEEYLTKRNKTQPNAGKPAQ
ncbi:MAG: thioredoxin fold domain-containing protein [candidate division KSB1 bacterium]|nr:thioredoxin fold domain-containing protein [candidate division KSB1 bacterium]MDZ7368899.1 thioredoxin fold domain-containing protein [candidate division KSB1 bacterium]MDZ7406887.1 thioredoxin fold domain-containing protein [candidate division KSB1 bacterium]